MFASHEMVIVASLPLPDSEDFIASVQSTAMPQILGLGGACLGVLLAVLLVRSLKGL